MFNTRLAPLLVEHVITIQTNNKTIIGIPADTQSWRLEVELIHPMAMTYVPTERCHSASTRKHC